MIEPDELRMEVARNVCEYLVPYMPSPTADNVVEATDMIVNYIEKGKSQ